MTPPGLELTTEFERLPGDALRIVLVLTNNGDDDYWLDDLAVTLALPDTSPSC